MPKYTVPDEQERKIMQENDVGPEGFAVVYRDDTTIRLLNHNTRDIVTIHKGDRPW